MTIVDVTALPDAVMLTMPMDKSWGYDISRDNLTNRTIEIQVCKEEAALYVTPDDLLGADWYNLTEVLMGFCGAGFNWREFSQLVRKIGVDRFAKMLLPITRECQYRAVSPEADSNGGYYSSDGWTSICILNRANSIKTGAALNGFKRTERSDIETTYLSLALYPTFKANVDVRLVLDLYSKCDINRILDLYSAGVAIEMIQTFGMTDIDGSLAVDLLFV